MNIRNLNPTESLPEWTTSFGYDPFWTWVLEEENDIKAVAITYPVFGKLFLFRLMAKKMSQSFWVEPFIKQVAKDSISRGIPLYCMITHPEEKILNIFHKHHMAEGHSAVISFGDWGGWL